MVSFSGNFGELLERFARPQMADVNADLRDERLRGLLKHASEEVPFYRDLYRAAKIGLESIRTPNDLWRLPALTKSDLVRAGPARYTDGSYFLPDAVSQRTSGTTGPPLSIFANSNERSALLAAMWSGWIGNGASKDDRFFLLHSRQLGYSVPWLVSTFCPLEMPMNRIIAQFRRFRPTVLIGLTESVPLLALELLRRNLSERHGVRAVYVLGETFTPQLRRMIEGAFDCEIYDIFGAAEVGWLGCECREHNGFHIPEDRIIVQAARIGRPNEPALPGEAGELIVTSFLRLTTPFIRYRLHDVAAIDATPCPCGRTSPRLMNVQGRLHDFLIATDGKGVPAMRIGFNVWLHRTAVMDYRVVQEEPRRLRISLVVDPELPPVDVADLKKSMRECLGDVEIEVEFVEQIPAQPSGKRRRIYRAFEPAEAQRLS